MGETGSCPYWSLRCTCPRMEICSAEHAELRPAACRGTHDRCQYPKARTAREMVEIARRAWGR